MKRSLSTDSQLAARRRLSGRLQSAPCWPPTLSNELVFQSSRPSGGDETSTFFFLRLFFFFFFSTVLLQRFFFSFSQTNSFRSRSCWIYAEKFCRSKATLLPTGSCCVQPVTSEKKLQNPVKFLQNLQPFPIRTKAKNWSLPLSTGLRLLDSAQRVLLNQ